jgi:hypothetical protein
MYVQPRKKYVPSIKQSSPFLIAPGIIIFPQDSLTKLKSFVHNRKYLEVCFAESQPGMEQ